MQPGGQAAPSGGVGRIEPRLEDDGYRTFTWSYQPQDHWDEGHGYKDWTGAQGMHLCEHPEEIRSSLPQTTWCADRAIEFIEEEREQPWL